jgi:nitrite reductase/ring-hydroxylating ferredoxin subunit
MGTTPAPELQLPTAPGVLRLAKAALLEAGTTEVFHFMRRGYAVEGLLLHHQSGFYAYLNQCQHWPIPLDFGDGNFFIASVDRIVCKTHGATYQPETGLCDSGPCHRSHLIRYQTEKEGDAILVHLTEE